jgi:hypothetical protein
MLKGLRFQKRLGILPGVRVNLSKSGVSASLGPRGADVNIGPHGVTTNAGIPGTGLSYRRKLGTHGSWLGVALLVGALAFWAGRHLDPAVPAKPAPAAESSLPAAVRHLVRPAAVRHPLAAAGPAFVHRGGAVLREAPKSSAGKLAKLAKGTEVTLLALEADGWAKVKSGAVTGYMRASVLGADRPAP